MSLLAYNLTGSPVILAAGDPSITLPASISPPARGKAVNVTSELEGLSAGDYTALEAQRPDVEYEWTADPEFDIGTLTIRLRSPQDPSVRWSSQSDWYVDPVAGHDDNDGAEDTPLATVGEYFRRVRGSVITVPVTITLVNDTTEPYIVGDGLNPMGTLLQGTSIIEESGEIDNVTGYIHTPGSAQYGTIDDATVDFAGHVNRKIILTSGTNVGAWAWILKDLGNSCVVSPWVRADGSTEITPSIGDDYDIVSLPTLTAIHVLNTTGPVTLRDLKVQGGGGTWPYIPAAYVTNGDLRLVGCELTSPTSETRGPVGGENGYMRLTGCCLHDFTGDVWRTSHMRMNFRGCVTVEFGYADEDDYFDHFHFTAVPSIGYGPVLKAAVTKIRNNSHIQFEVALGVIADAFGDVLKLGSTCQALVGSFGALWSLAVGGGDQGIWLLAGSKLIWRPSSKTAAEKFEFPVGIDDDILFDATGKTLAEVGSGYIDLVADTGTGVITGSGAMAMPNNDIGF